MPPIDYVKSEGEKSSSLIRIFDFLVSTFYFFSPPIAQYPKPLSLPSVKKIKTVK